MPNTDEALNAAAVSTWTLLGAIGFFIAAFLLVEEREPGGAPAATGEPGTRG